MTSPRKTNHNSHSSSPLLLRLGDDATIRHTIAPQNFRAADKDSSSQRIVFRFGNGQPHRHTDKARSHLAVRLQVLSTSSVPVVFVWGRACVRFTNERSRTRRKSNARSCRAMHVCADRSLAWLAKRFGQSKLLKRWLPSLAARFAPPPMKSPANENRPRSRSSLSSQKSHQSAPRRRPF